MFEQPKFNILQKVDVPRWWISDGLIVGIELKIAWESQRSDEQTHWQYDVYHTNEDGVKEKVTFSEWFINAYNGVDHYCQCVWNEEVGKRCNECHKIKYIWSIDPWY